MTGARGDLQHTNVPWIAFTDTEMRLLLLELDKVQRAKRTGPCLRELIRTLQRLALK